MARAPRTEQEKIDGEIKWRAEQENKWDHQLKRVEKDVADIRLNLYQFHDNWELKIKLNKLEQVANELRVMVENG